MYSTGQKTKERRARRGGAVQGVAGYIHTVREPDKEEGGFIGGNNQ
jgi:hypothetical protein